MVAATITCVYSKFEMLDSTVMLGVQLLQTVPINEECFNNSIKHLK